jgi:hypothetical protein
MEDWLREKPNRTLLFVPRSYHADPDYLDAIEEKLTPREIADSRFPQERHDSRRRLRDVVDAPWARDVTSIEFEAIEEIENALNEEDWQDREIEVEIPEEEENDAATNEGPIDGGWYVLEKRDEPLSVAELSGEPKWAGNIDPQNTRLKLYQKFTPKEAETLLAAQDDAVLVARREIGESQLLLVPGGMFLVNMQLIPESHRKLAGRLISEFGSAEQRILFLNAGHHPPRGDQTESGYDMPLGMHLLTIWPTSLILWQFLVLGILLCFWKWPAFGRRRRLPDPPLADFGEHIDAIAQLQRSTKRSGYPREQWMRYWNLVQPHSRPPDSTSGDEA